MALEDLEGSSKFIDDLDEANPVGTADNVSTLDDHIRGVKNVLKNTFPNITEAITWTAAALNSILDDTPLTGITTIESAAIASYNEVAAEYSISAGTKIFVIDTSTYFYPAADMGAAAITFQFTTTPVAPRVSSFTMEMLGADDATITWPASVKWGDAGEPVWSAGTDVVSFSTRNGGTTWLASVRGFNY